MFCAFVRRVCMQHAILIIEINSHVALFRDMLILVGQPRDCPELREKIRKLRRTCVETSKHMTHLIMTQLKRYVYLPFHF
uniref:Syntaxin N-terminal domain-containing protein n=1 Tax=Glossina pallidipes TaxID=7398 RepID=A0A1B0ACK8_GLOPL